MKRITLSLGVYSIYTRTHHSALYTFLPLFKKKYTGVGDLSPRLGLSAASCASEMRHSASLSLSELGTQLLWQAQETVVLTSPWA